MQNRIDAHISTVMAALDMIYGQNQITEPCTEVTDYNNHGQEHVCGAATSFDCDYCHEAVCETHTFMCNCGSLLHSGNCAVLHKTQECKAGGNA